MPDEETVIGRVEKLRLEKGLAQVAVADACRLSQGHYSKLVARKVPLGRKSERALLSWLDAQGAAGRLGMQKLAERDILALIASMQKDFSTLTHLLQALESGARRRT